MPEGALLTAAEERTLAAVCDALIPALAAGSDLEQRSASALGVPGAVAAAIAGTGDPQDLVDLKRLLAVLGGPAGALLAGSARPLHRRDAAGREALLQAWATSPVADIRKGFAVLKRLAGFFFLAHLDGEGRNPNWASIGYNGPPAPPALEPPVQVSTLSADAEWHADAVVVGSGAGGGVAAWELTRRGMQVVVLELGEAMPEEQMGGPELRGMERMYLDRGLAATTDAAFAILAGSCLGGGTTVNWTACLPPPEWLLDEWEREGGVSGISGKEFRAALADVLKRLGVTAEYSTPAPDSSAGRLLAGCQALGYRAQTCWRNVRDCGDNCGDCCFGCPYGAKQSTPRTYLHDANARGCRILCGAHVEKVLSAAAGVSGVQAQVRTPAGGLARLTVHAPLVVVAAGAIGTPALLLRSGVSNPHLGRHLHLHPTTAIVGRYPQPVESWKGRLLPAYSNQFAHLDGHYGVLLEVAPAHPGLAALATPWYGGAQYKHDLARLDRAGNLIALVRDRGEGRVYLDGHGRRRIQYRLDPYDAQHLRRGIAEALRVHGAAGAEAVFTLHAERTGCEAPPGGRLRREDVEAVAEQVQRRSVAPHRLALFSAHQMGTARLGPGPQQAVAGPDGQVFGRRGLYVADASAFPAASGVNPMVTIMALAAWVSRGAQPAD